VRGSLVAACPGDDRPSQSHCHVEDVEDDAGDVPFTTGVVQGVVASTTSELCELQPNARGARENLLRKSCRATVEARRAKPPAA